MIKLTLFIVVFALFQVVKSEDSGNQAYSDVRCKCVCPKEVGSELNQTRNVFVATVEPDQCNCQHIVKREESFCLRCQCMFEARNTILIKVVIIFIIVLLICLTVYAVYLCVDSKMSAYELSVKSDEILFTVPFNVTYSQIPIKLQEQLANRSRRRRAFSVRAIDQRHARWKQQVAAQRRHIYDTRTMLS